MGVVGNFEWMKMNIIIKLNNPKRCNGCPCLNNIPGPFCCHYGKKLNRGKPKSLIVFRPKRCIEQNN